MLLVGVANLVFAVLALATDIVRLAPPTASSLLVAGLLTAAAGLSVATGSTLALAISLTVFSVLLVVQLGEIAGGGTPFAESGPRLVVLSALVIALAVAQLRRRRRT